MTLAIGMLNSARMKRMAAKISAIVRNARKRFQSVGRNLSTPAAIAIGMSRAVANSPRKNRISPSGITGLASLISVSLIRNRRLAAEIARMPRRFSRKGVISVGRSPHGNASALTFA